MIDIFQCTRVSTEVRENLVLQCFRIHWHREGAQGATTIEAAQIVETIERKDGLERASCGVHEVLPLDDKPSRVD